MEIEQNHGADDPSPTTDQDDKMRPRTLWLTRAECRALERVINRELENDLLKDGEVKV